jgi:hypothetical protein
MPASPTGEAGIVRVDLLQRDPDPEEPEAPLVEPGIPDGCFVVPVVVNGAVSPWPTGWRKRPVPRRTWRLTPSPRRGPVSPRGTVEVAALRIAAPGAARSTRATGSARMVEPGSAWATRSARVIGRRSAWPTGTAGTARVIGSTGASGSAGSARIIGSGRAVIPGRRRAVITGSRRRRSRSGECRTGTHAQCCSTKSARDGSPRNELL